MSDRNRVGVYSNGEADTNIFYRSVSSVAGEVARSYVPFIRYTPATLQNAVRLLADVIPRVEPRILDVGTGTGVVARAVANVTSGSVVGLDISLEMISALRAGAYSQVTGIVADARRLPFLSGHFDAVVFAFSLHLFEEPLSALSEAARVLKPGGRIAVLCPLLEDLQKQLFHKYMPHFHRHDAPRTLTLQKLQAWVEQVGLRNGPLLREDFEIPFGTPDEFVEFVQHKPFFGLQQITEEEFQADIAHLKSELARHPSGVPVVTQGTLTTVVYDKRKEKLG